jgi:phage tail sheath protein FI
VSSSSELAARYAPPADAASTTAHLATAVDGFFANGGSLCFVVVLDPVQQPRDAMRRGLASLDAVDEVDLVCAPDAVRRLTGHAALPLPREEAVEMTLTQRLVLEDCDRRGDRFAVLDSLPRAGVDDVLAQRSGLLGKNGALYYPWIRTRAGGDEATAFGPPSGHVAGVYARTDERFGVHKAPANEVLQGVLDLATDVSNDQQARLNPLGVNCLRAFPGRGIRVWGARTLSPEPAWAQVSVRRLFVTAARWIDRAFAHLVFEPNGPEVWDYVERELGDYFNELYRRGALRGDSPGQAFRIKCDAETNTPERREAGEIVTEIGLAPGLPNEFVIVQIVHRAEGITIAGPTRAG